MQFLNSLSDATVRRSTHQRRLSMLVITTFKIINSSHFICCFESLKQSFCQGLKTTRTHQKGQGKKTSRCCQIQGYMKALLQRPNVQLISWAPPSTLRLIHSRKGWLGTSPSPALMLSPLKHKQETHTHTQRSSIQILRPTYLELPENAGLLQISPLLNLFACHCLLSKTFYCLVSFKLLFHLIFLFVSYFNVLFLDIFLLVLLSLKCNFQCSCKPL